MLYLNLSCVALVALSALFNFNKCCIWIALDERQKEDYYDLTLTSVVFECNCFLPNVTSYSYLTLTSVVFE